MRNSQSMTNVKCGDECYTEYAAYSKGDVELFPHQLWKTKIISKDSNKKDHFWVKWIRQRDKDIPVHINLIYDKKQLILVKNPKKIKQLMKINTKNAVWPKEIEYSRFKRFKESLKSDRKRMKSARNFLNILETKNKCINNILLAYKKADDNENENDKQAKDDVINCIRDNFNLILPFALLHKQEREEFNRIYNEKGEEFDYCEILGIEYLYRWILKMPSFIYFHKNETETLKIFNKQIQNLLEFLDKNQ